MPETIAHYNILERLGGGALGEVYRARDTRVGRTVALVQPPPHLVSDATRRARFLEDAGAAGTLNHPNIAALFEVVEQDDRCYLVYEFVAGPSLRQEMDGIRLGVRRAVELAAQIADALAEGHARGVVHGDLRPETVVVTAKGSTKILNFGMVPWTAGGAARTLAALSPQSLTPEQVPVAGYLSPEQAVGGRIDARSDLFSLAVMLHEMLTGKRPFEAPTAAATVARLSRGAPPPASRQNPEVPPELDAVLARAMSKDIDTRHQSAALFAADLRSVVTRLDVRSGDQRVTTPNPLEEDSRSSRWWPAVILAVGAAAAAAWWIW